MKIGKSISKNSVAITAITLFGMFCTFLSGAVTASVFGAGTDMDTYYTATAIPALLITIITGCMNYVLIPLFSEYRTKTPYLIASLARLFLKYIAMLCLIFFLIVFIGAPLWVRCVAPGFPAFKQIKTIELVRWLSPMIILSGINDIMASLYYSGQRYILPSINKIIGPLLTVIFVLLLGKHLSVKALAISTITGMIIQMVLLAIPFIKEFGKQDSSVVNDQSVRIKVQAELIRAIKLMAPLLFGMFFYRAIPIIDRFFLSRYPEGAISHIGYAFKLESMIAAIVPAGLTVTLFPSMARFASNLDYDGMIDIFQKGVRMLFFITIPVAILIALSGESFVKFAFQRRAFTANDTVEVYRMLVLYLFSLPAACIGNLVSQCYYSIKKIKILVFISVLEVFEYVILCLVIMPFLKWYTIPFVYSLYFNFSLLIYPLVLSKIIKKQVLKGLGIPILQDLGIAILCGGIFVLLKIITPWENIIVDLIFLGIGFSTYLTIHVTVFKSYESISILKTINDMFTRIYHIIVPSRYAR